MTGDDAAAWRSLASPRLLAEPALLVEETVTGQLGSVADAGWTQWGPCVRGAAPGGNAASAVGCVNGIVPRCPWSTMARAGPA